MASNSKRKRNVLKLEILNRLAKRESNFRARRIITLSTMKRMKTRATTTTKVAKLISNADALSALETAMKWYEQESECCSTPLLLLKRIRDLAMKKRRCTMVQRKINDYFPQ
ncbi:uncharacterized protein TNCV_4555201 [Trichonephila clavipes]|nr:uncharacterized protein TNCV_4555201 [Trichonephila clavipes]